jgi:hypothetical protein
MNTNNLIALGINIDLVKPSFSIETNWLIVVFAIAIIAIWKFTAKWIPITLHSESTFEINTGLLKYNSKIKRNFQNIEIANRIYIELVTRKAAIPFDLDNDVISEVYDSWYNLFETIRKEIKSLPGEYLIKKNHSRKLIEVSVNILNFGLRPHLTKYQADFRKFYKKAINDINNELLSPQEIQMQYKNYSELIESMQQVNILLIEYSKQLKKIIDG